MPVAPEYPPGASAPQSGTYELLKVMGTPQGPPVQVNEGDALPPAPFGWGWRLVRPDTC